jgi:SulP family sulfate permease
MVEVSGLRALWRSTRADAAVLSVTFGATVLLDLATAVVLGIVLAGGLALRQLARTAELQVLPAHEASPAGSHTEEEQALLHEHIIAYRLEGPLFFLGAHNALLELAEVSDIRVVVLRMSRVTTLDSTAAAVLADTVRGLESRGIDVLVSGVPEQFHRVLATTGLLGELAAREHVFTSTVDAIAHARRHVARDVKR